MSQLQWREAARTILGAWSYVPSISEWACNYYGLLLSWTTAYITMFLPNKWFSSVNTIARCSVHVRVVHPSSCECAYAYVLKINTFGWRIVLYLAYNYIHDIMLSCSWHFIVSLCMRKSPMTLLVPRPYHVFQRYTQRWKTPALHQIGTNQVCKHRSATYRWKIDDTPVPGWMGRWGITLVHLYRLFQAYSTFRTDTFQKLLSPIMENSTKKTGMTWLSWFLELAYIAPEQE